MLLPTSTSVLPLRFHYPELLLLAVPLWFLYRRYGTAHGVTGWLRTALLSLAVLVLMGPEINLGGQGVDVIVVVDRSRSMPAESHVRMRELIDNLLRGRGPGDRVGVVGFGSEAAWELPLTAGGEFRDFVHPVSLDGSDLDAALSLALNSANPYRPTRIMVFSDGEANGPSPNASARLARDRKVPIDFRPFERPRIGDAAVQAVLLPDEVAPREPFQFTAVIYADQATQGKITVLRDGEPIASTEREFRPGETPVMFRDLLELGGLRQYEVRLEVENDPLVENNRGAGVVRVEAGPRVLVLNETGAPDNFVRALEAARIPVDVRRAAGFAITADALDAYRAVVVENVTATSLGRSGMNALAQFVEDLGGGLMLTGGERSFGNGGYFNSPLDEVLPVSMEMREEHRKMNVAIAIALDRSGSMMAPVRGGKQKMDLANLGTAECVRLLSPGDSVAVIAVDSSPHIIQPLTNVEHPDAIASKVLKIQSMGGGIFVYEALVAAGNELLKASQSTKHIILFSDAADSEEPGDYKNLLKKYEQTGITVSVIGLGTDRDPDAALLKEIARLGSGNIMFTEDAEELPRLFTEDTMSIARSSFVKKEENQPLGIPGHRVPDARLMGEIASGPFPPVDGFNLSYLKPEATLGAISDDEYAAPWSAFWYRGLGRCAALTVEVDGQFTGQFAAWDEYADYLVTHVRWLIGSDAPEGAYLAVSRDGQDAVVTLELDPQRAASLESINPMLRLVPPGEDRPTAQRIPFEWQGPATLQARFKMAEFGTYRPIVELPDGPARGPAVTLPYSPEFMPRVGLPEGREVLAEVAMISGGVERIDPVEAFKNPPRSATTRPLIPPLLITMIVLLLVEIAGRRLSLWERLIEPPAPVQVPAGLPVRPAARTARAPRTAATAPALPVAAPAPVAKPEESARPAAASAPGTVDVLAQAKRRARQRK